MCANFDDIIKLSAHISDDIIKLAKEKIAESYIKYYKYSTNVFEGNVICSEGVCEKYNFSINIYLN